MKVRTIIAMLAMAAALAGYGCGAGDNRFEKDAVTDGPSGTDQDGDTISDMDEGRGASTDTDGDTVPDYQDEDSDGDTIPDQFEAGDYDTGTPLGRGRDPRLPRPGLGRQRRPGR